VFRLKSLRKNRGISYHTVTELLVGLMA